MRKKGPGARVKGQEKFKSSKVQEFKSQRTRGKKMQIGEQGLSEPIQIKIRNSLKPH